MVEGTSTYVKKEPKELETKIGKEKLGHIVGQTGQGMFSLPKLMYIKKQNLYNINSAFLFIL